MMWFSEGVTIEIHQDRRKEKKMEEEGNELFIIKFWERK